MTLTQFLLVFRGEDCHLNRVRLVSLIQPTPTGVQLGNSWKNVMLSTFSFDQNLKNKSFVHTIIEHCKALW